MKWLTLVAALLLATPLLAQSVRQPEQCSTMERDSILRARFPERGTLDDFENALLRKVESMRAEQRAGRTMAEVLTIPIIFHIVHNGEAVGTGTNISQAQVQSQLDVLNEDFRKLAGSPGFNNNPVGADIEVEFCLSPLDENGRNLTEPGIVRLNGNRADWTQDQIDNQLKPTTIWNPNLFYNVWTVKFAASEGGLLGYAQFPDQTGLQGIPANSPASTDGVVIAYNTCGSSKKGNFPILVDPYDMGRTLTHETGHWLGLRHIWGDGRCADDFVADTPPQIGPSSGCPNPVTQSCPGGSPAMVQNYMDYSNDPCKNIFTVGQKNRIRAAIELSPRRKSVVQGNLCSPTVNDVPVANFTAANKGCVLLGSTVEFTDLSTNFPTEWSWTFEGGDPGSSTDRNPKVTYNTPGSFKVTLTATNSVGPSEPFTIESYINVSEEGLCNELSNFEDSFTPSLIKISNYNTNTGYLTGHNSAGSLGYSEFYENACGYQYVSGATVNFAKAKSLNEEATVDIVVWSARGVQGGPNPVIERKTVLYKQIMDDIANSRPTTITFDRVTPVFSRPFHIGFEITYASGDTVAVYSSKDGEATNATSWVKHANGQWQLITTAYGANIAMDISPIVGANPSVQVSASKVLVYPGEQVVLNGQGASIFVWNADDGSVNNHTGPQLIVNPQEEVTYTTTGSGLDLCNNTATTTIYIRQDVVAVEETDPDNGVSLYPNPGTKPPHVQINNDYVGEVSVWLNDVTGHALGTLTATKDFPSLAIDLPSEASAARSGVYYVVVEMGKTRVVRKWIKIDP
ncbi:M43 family zinc metalloprotease [Chryseolinea sp. T2]|uniref:M43 family zinc metalloprotease n=1 Tax=Chryseolinea sp. T2 TaxID=3129255 RepID=UPI00307792EB